MAKDAKPADEAGEAVAPKKSKKLLIIIIAAVVVLLGVGGTAAYFLMHKSADHVDEEDVAAEQSGKKKKGEKEVPPAYVAFDAFTVNLVPETGDQFLQLIISAEVADIIAGDRLKMYTPKLRNSVMLLLSGKKASELVTKEGKEKLAEEIRDEMNSIVEIPAVKGKPAQEAVKEVLFTSFIIQ
jgi:flagellar FliL protein